MIKKKGQMEIMGLIVIVVLLTLAMFFIVSFTATKPKNNIQQSFSDDQLASKFLISFLKTNAGCRQYPLGDYTLEALIQDCGSDRRIICQGLDSCTFVNETMNIFVNQTLVKWKKDFNFTIKDLPIDITFFDNCGAGKNKDVAWQPLSLYPNPKTIIVKLDICD